MKTLSFLLIIISLLIACSKKEAHIKNQETNVAYDIAFDFRTSNKLDSAFKYFNTAKDIFLSQNDSLGVAKCLANMGYISTTKGDFFGAQELSLKALDYFNNESDSQFVYIKSNYNNLGRATYQLKDYDNSIRFYDYAIKFSKDSSDTRIYLNNKAKTYQEVKKYNEALKIYKLSLKGVKPNGSEYARTSTNIALTKWLQNPNYNAVPAYLAALNIRLKENDLWGQNSSFVHLAEFYVKKRPDSALIYAQKAYRVAKQINSANDQLWTLQLLINLSEPQVVKKYFTSYKILDDSVQNAQNAAKNQFALIRYESEKSKIANLQLQKENDTKQYQIVKREIIIISVLLLVIVIAVFAWFWYKKRNQQLKLQQENNIRENQLKISKKIHDVVANGLYRVMAEVENAVHINKDILLDKIEDLYEKSRDISYDEIKLDETNFFHDKISSLIKSFANSKTKVVIVGNTQQLWNKLSTNAQHDIEHAIQNIMVNMKRHSRASNVILRFEEQDNQIKILYRDNGIGISKEIKFNNGLTNTVSRINGIGGTIIFDDKVDKGLVIQILIPFS